MAGIRVVTDSAADLPAALAQKYDIRIVPLDVRLGQWGPEEMRLIDPAEFWRRCAMTDALPETSAPSPGAFAQSFAQAADDGCDGVVCLTLSSGLSSTYQAACAGAEEVRGRIDVRVVDTRTVTLGQAMVVLEAARVGGGDRASSTPPRRRPGRPSPTSASSVPSTRWTTSAKGGRIGAAKALMGSLLSIKPIVEIRDGVAVEESKQRTRAGSLDVPRRQARDTPASSRASPSPTRRRRTSKPSWTCSRGSTLERRSSSTTSARSSGLMPGQDASASATGWPTPPAS